MNHKKELLKSLWVNPKVSREVGLASKGFMWARLYYTSCGKRGFMIFLGPCTTLKQLG